MFENILVICIGNICRSPMAEALLKKSLIEAGKTECTVYSAGLGALVGHKPDPNACQLMLGKGVDISSYQARQLNREMVAKADLILVMELAHKTAIEKHNPSTKGKVFRLGEWGEFDIPDPYKQELKAFESALKLIEVGVAQWINKI